MSVPDLDRLRRRAAVVHAIRRFFDDAGFLEVDTPVALTAPAPEPYIEAPRVVFKDARAPGEAPGERFRYLQPSPELPMKRLLSAGLPRIYQIAPVFRDEPLGPYHNPEFRLLEWYRRDAGWEELLADCEGLLLATAAAAGWPLRSSIPGRELDLTPPFFRLSVDAAFVAHAGFSILACLEPAALGAELDRLGIFRQPDDTWNDLYHRAFLVRVEPAILASRRPVFLTDFPAPLASLARKNPKDPRVAERFELYAGGFELANGFGELTDPREQAERFDRDQATRRKAGMYDYPIDRRFLDALADLPPSAGIALGLDRLLMLLLGASHLDEVSFIPWRET